MTSSSVLTAEQFIAQRYDLPDGGRWSELVEGRVTTFTPPDEQHGAVVLNLTKALAAHLQPGRETETAYACFDLGLIVGRDPDTVRFPQVCLFTDGGRFARTDQEVTEDRPALVVEIASTNDRRRGMADRLNELLHWGVGTVWVADTVECAWHIHTRGQPGRQLSAPETLTGKPHLPGFRIPVADLFAEPQWWRG